MKRYVILAASLSVLGFASAAHAQVFPSSTGDNSAMITQTGNQNRANIDQAIGGLSLNGQNSAEISQIGNSNNATVNQTSSNSVSPNAVPFLNTALIAQNRARGIASIDQIHDYAVTRFNEARILQNSNDAEASIDQRGDRNTARIFQRGGSVAPNASIEQNGRSNIAIVNQRTGASGTVEVSQGDFGGGNILSPQTFTSRVDVDHNGANADIFVTQIGFTHNADVFEDGTNGIIDVRMDGALNTANVIQESSNGLVAISSTSGSFSNVARVTQDVSDNGSSAFVLQSGSLSVSDIEQLGGTGVSTANFADVIQSGDGLTPGSIESMIIQNGSLNEATVNQSARVAESTVLQTGIGHLASVTQ
jgi:hypothetical protein